MNNSKTQLHKIISTSKPRIMYQHGFSPAIYSQHGFVIARSSYTQPEL